MRKYENGNYLKNPWEYAERGILVRERKKILEQKIRKKMRLRRAFEANTLSNLLHRTTRSTTEYNWLCLFFVWPSIMKILLSKFSSFEFFFSRNFVISKGKKKSEKKNVRKNYCFFRMNPDDISYPNLLSISYLWQ